MHYGHYGQCGPGYAFGGRHRRHRGIGPFGRHSGGPGGRGFKPGRMLRDGDLRLIALALIEQEPRHGYDIIRALEERSGGFYSPSPGVVYPTLTFLDEAGYVTAAAEGNKKIYTIAEEGTAHLDEHRDRVEVLLSEMEAFGAKMERANRYYDWAEGGSDDRSTASTPAMKDLDQARRRLRALIIAATEGTEADQQRVTEILQRASDEILGKTPGS